MARAQSQNLKNFVSHKAIEVPESLVAGEKFIKWDEDGGMVGTPVTLRVDPKGFYLYWVDQNHEMDLIDISHINDTRTGRYAKIPKEAKLRQIVTMGSQDTLEEKTVTVAVGHDFVNINFYNFCCTKREIAQHWTDELMKLAYNLNQIDGTPQMYLRKAYTKLCLQTDKTGKIPVKNITKLFAQSRDDKKRLETVLSGLGLPYGKNDTISLSKFTFEDFFKFYVQLTTRSEVEKVFNEFVGTKKYMTAEQFVEFLNKTQRDPRLNEILYPYANTARARDVIEQHEPNKYMAQKGQLSFNGFLRYLLSEDNNIIAATKFELTDDMDQPLAHYFINSSHNTYLCGHQLTGKASPEMYRQCLLAGCRCVELDFWNGRTEEPVIVHGYTFVPEISAREVLEAIAETAFKTSDYPVILSFENHCNPRQQAKIAGYCREIFGDMLLEAPLESHRLEPGASLPPPSLLKRKIIIKNKKKHHHHHHHHKRAPAAVEPPPQPPEAHQGSIELTGNGESALSHHPPSLPTRQISKDSSTEDEESSTDDEAEHIECEAPINKSTEGGSAEPTKQSTETEAGSEISALVNYVQPIHFSSFENAKKKKRCYEMSSFDERQATSLLKEYPIQFVNYNKHQLSRVYPVGTRFDSSNFMPQVFWNAGCQLVALNYQTLDLAMQLNLGIFEYNFRSGYLLKPEFMRRTDRRFYPFAESTVDGIVAGNVKIQVISGQFLTDKRVGTYVEVEMYGLPADTVRKRFKTKVIPCNGINPVYDEDPFIFKKVVLPELASIRIVAYEEGGKFIGHRILPVMGLCPGYRHVNLRTDLGQPLPLATLFLHVVVKDYVPDGLSEFADALANPIKYQSDLDKRTHQLAVLIEGLEPTEIEEQKKNSLGRNPKEQINGSPPPNSATTSGNAASISSTPADTQLQNNTAHSSTATATLPNLSATDTNAQSKVVELKIECKAEEIVAETLEKFMENKLVREKKLELDKKMESLRKKHEKKKQLFHSQKSGDYSEKRSKLINMRLVKRLSSKNVLFTSSSGVFSTESPSAEPLTSVEDADVSTEDRSRSLEERGIPRSQSERLLAMNRDLMTQEKELRERYLDSIYSTLEKVMKQSQNSQLKTLKDQFEKETNELMRKLQSDHREEVKMLSKKHRNREQFTRVKREAVTAVVDRGVSEREKLGQVFEVRKDLLLKQHEAVREQFLEHKEKARQTLQKEFQTRLAQVNGECSSGVP